jgi:quercetin 2,3-dioxygenase
MNMYTANGQRTVQLVVPSEAAMEGAGVRIRRALGIARLPDLDPFLLLDEIHSDDPDAYLAGFPPHPHRGVETVTYMLSGQMHHKDSTGGEGVISTGDVQWMTTGRGIIHSEMPGQVDGLMWGFQLWVNLPAREKMREAAYIELKSQDIPEVRVGETSIRVISGSWQGAVGPAPQRSTEPVILDVRMPAGSTCDLAVPAEHTAFVYTYQGQGRFGPEGRAAVVPPKATAVLSKERNLHVKADLGVRFLLIAGRPLNEPIAKAGPFVMNTEAELVQAFRDYQAGRLVVSDGASAA